MIPSYIIPHIDKERAIVIMQAVENIEFIERQHQKLHRYISKSIDIEGIGATSAYQHFTNLLK